MNDNAATTDTPPVRAPNNRARAGRIVALVGALVVVLAGKSFVMPLVPTDHEVEIRFDSPEDIVGVDIRWSPESSGEDITATSFRFSQGKAPASLMTNVHVPDGAYDVAIAIERETHVDSSRRRVALGDAARVTIPVR
ncbi:MAG: hypothetical protein IPK82_32325 [Polyangiaceae bacterium]|nr:hypothetical protein [Polyangiaceae bacterium]